MSTIRKAMMLKVKLSCGDSNMGGRYRRLTNASNGMADCIDAPNWITGRGATAGVAARAVSCFVWVDEWGADRVHVVLNAGTDTATSSNTSLRVNQRLSRDGGNASNSGVTLR